MEKSNLIGKHVIVRSDLAGVFFGILTAKNGEELTLSNARKIYYFSGANTVEDISAQGVLNKEESKITAEVSEVVIGSFVQILLCTDKAIANLKSVKVWSFK